MLPHSQFQLNEFFFTHLLNDFIEDYQASIEHNSKHYLGQISYEHFLNFITAKMLAPYYKTTWCLGGSYGDYNGGISSASPEVETDLEGLDSFLIKHYPNVSFMQYKMIEKKIEKKNEYESDYYGGSITNGCKQLSFTDFSNILVSLGLIPVGKLIDNHSYIYYIKECFPIEKFEEKFPVAVTNSEKLKALAQQPIVMNSPLKKKNVLPKNNKS